MTRNTERGLRHRMAAIYLRSSKDKKDVSLATQRAALQELAKRLELVIVEDFHDTVISGMEESRPALDRLRREVNRPDCPFGHLLIYDTSRLARDIHVAIPFESICRRSGVTIHYRTMDGVTGPIRDLMLRVTQATDQMHSQTSREKGIAGMRENLRRGYRAGGRPPVGYQLRRIGQGLVRDGQEITKTVLEPGPDFDQVASFLRMRIEGVPRTTAAARAGLAIAAASAVNIEWMALTYAGFHVWNVHRDRREGMGPRRRPRDEWVIEKAGHPAMITEGEALQLIQALERNSRPKRVGASRRKLSDHLLTEILWAPDGRRWSGDQVDGERWYRIRKRGDDPGRAVKASEVDEVLVQAVMTELTKKSFVAKAHAEIVSRQTDRAREQGLREQIRAKRAIVDALIEEIGLTDMHALRESIRRRLAVHQQDLTDLEAALAQAVRENRQAITEAAMAVEEVEQMLATISAKAGRLPSHDLKGFLGGVIDRAVLCPDTLELEISFRVGRSGIDMASPRGFEPRLSP